LGLAEPSRRAFYSPVPFAAKAKRKNHATIRKPQPSNPLLTELCETVFTPVCMPPSCGVH
jgi:hypothetical protein